MDVSETHKNIGEAFGFVTWLWIFYRARNDLPVVLGWRHPWDHAEDPWASVGMDEEVQGIEELRADWDSFQEKATVPGDGDDDDDDDDDDEEDDDEEEDEDDDE